MPQVINNLLSTPDPLDTPVNRGDVVVLRGSETGLPISLLALPVSVEDDYLHFIELSTGWIWNRYTFCPGSPAKNLRVGSHPIIEVIPASKVQIVLNRME